MTALRDALVKAQNLASEIHVWMNDESPRMEDKAHELVHALDEIDAALADVPVDIDAELRKTLADTIRPIMPKTADRVLDPEWEDVDVVSVWQVLAAMLTAYLKGCDVEAAVRENAPRPQPRPQTEYREILADELLAVPIKDRRHVPGRPLEETFGDATAAALVRAMHRAHTSAIPPGWALVPVEPDRAMFSAARDASRTGQSLGNWLADYQTKPVWSAMLAAAPKPGQENS